MPQGEGVCSRKHPARGLEITMPTQCESPTHAPVTLVVSTYRTYNKCILNYSKGWRVGHEQLKRSNEQNASKLAVAGKADVPGIS